MDLYELQLKHLLDVKLMRITKPKFSLHSLPMSGSYNSVEALLDLERNSEFKLENKIKEFNINEENSVSTDNMFVINNLFGKVLFGETLEILLIINNKADSQVTIREIKVKLSNEALENFEACHKKVKTTLFSWNESFTIDPYKSNTQKLRFQVEIISKYSVEIDVFYCCKLFDDEYAKHALTKIIKTLSAEYYIEPNKNCVVGKFYKRFTFAANLPFKLKERIVNDSMERALLEINIINICPYPLNINNVILSNDKESLEIQKVNEPKYPCLIEPEEEINNIYIFPKYESIVNIVNFNLKISWKHLFDSSEKSLNFIIKNKLINELFSLKVLEKPPSNIIYDQYNKVIFQISNKVTTKNLKIKFILEKTNENELDIIDVLNDEFILKDNALITVICKSHWKGNVFLPKITIIDDVNKKTFTFEKLLNFYCIDNLKTY